MEPWTGWEKIQEERGPPGSGKTQRLLAVARKYRADGFKTALSETVLEGEVIETLYVKKGI